MASNLTHQSHALLRWAWAFAAFAAVVLGANSMAVADPELRALATAKFQGLASLDEVAVPKPSNLAEFVKDEKAAIALGKAFFWDVQVGSETQACASCHFQAGGDNRVKNQLSPGLLRVSDPARQSDPDNTFGYAASGAMAGPNYTLTPGDFPFHKLSDPNERNSSVTFDTNDVTSSQGTFHGGFVSLPRGHKRNIDECGTGSDAFNVNGIAVRKVEPRNTPTQINAVFNHRNFWDGRASNIFNGLNPLGRRGNLPSASDANPGVLVMQPDGSVVTQAVEIDNASLASQSVGPPLSDFEMSCAGRTFADLGRKLRTRFALALQQVAGDDSVLGPYVPKKGNGLNIVYQGLIQKAFHDKYWAKKGNEQLFTADGEPLPAGSTAFGYTQMEVNFALFWGLAIQLYEATLVSGQTRVDAFMKGNDGALNDKEKLGLRVFVDKGKCVNCHVGPEFTGASVRLRAMLEPIERMAMGDGGTAVYDGGFYNIGVRPTREDLGVGADLAGFPLSFARQEVLGQKIDRFNVDPSTFEVAGPVVARERVAVDGAFKVPTIRNVELTGPYFHNGGQSTLRQVVDFYNRGGDRRNANRAECPDSDPGEGMDQGDTTGFDGVCSNVAPDIVKLGLLEVEADALVAFMLALTDERVKYERAPFDHPQLMIPNGHPGDRYSVIEEVTGKGKHQVGTGQARDEFLELPAVGAAGRRAPLRTFLDLSPFAR
jgi:cytochrome c peroxidase